MWAGWALSQQFYRDELYKRMGFDSVETFLTDFWEAFWVKCDANDLLCQLHVWQTADISKTPGYDGDLKRALGAITARCIQSPGEKDLYFPPRGHGLGGGAHAARRVPADSRPLGPFLRGRHRPVLQRVPRQLDPHAAGALRALDRPYAV